MSNINYRYNRWYHHAWDSLKPPWPLLAHSFAVFATLWTLIEATSFFGENETKPLKNGWFYAYLIVFSLVSGFVFSFIRYWNAPPKFAEHLPRSAQRIIKKQAKGWEFHLAQLLFVRSFERLDRRLEGILNGTSLIFIRPTMTVAEYMEYIRLRMNNMMRMGPVAHHIVTSFPKCFENDLSPEKRVELIERAVEKVEVFYKATIALEEELHSTGVPEGFEALHKMQSNWSEVARVPFREILQFLQSLRESVGIKGDIPKVERKLTMEAPEKIEDFIRELSRLERLHLRDSR